MDYDSTNKSVDEILTADPDTLTSYEMHLRLDFKLDKIRGIEPYMIKSEKKLARWKAEWQIEHDRKETEEFVEKCRLMFLNLP